MYPRIYFNTQSVAVTARIYSLLPISSPLESLPHSGDGSKMGHKQKLGKRLCFGMCPLIALGTLRLSCEKTWNKLHMETDPCQPSCPIQGLCKLTGLNWPNRHVSETS